MTKDKIKKILESIYDKLDNIQESDYVQTHGAMMFDIGEAMGSVDNALDDLEKDK